MKTAIPGISGLRKAFFHDRSLLSTASHQRVSFVTRENIERSFMLIREGHQLDRTELQHVQTLINRCPKSDNILEVLDENGWNVLQRAIICNQSQVVQILITRGCDLNTGACTLPLHLATKCGHAVIVQMLLDSGAKADIAKRVCYPVNHMKPTTLSGKSVAKFQCKVAKNPFPPITYAFPSDRHEVMRVLLTHRTSRDLIKKEFLLHEACKFRAKRCLKLLVEMLPEQVNVRDRKGLTPLQHALQGHKNRDCAVILLESNAYFDEEIFETETGTLLHQIYVSDDTSHLLRLTELMLEKGPEDLAMMVTKGDGDTLLNKLLKHYGSATPRERDQYVREVRQCVALLIDHGCDPNQTNKKGEGALHSLLAHHSGRPLFYMRDRFGVAPVYLVGLLESMLPLLQELLERGANANLMSPPNVVSPLYYLMRVVCSMSPQLLGATCKQVAACVETLCAYNADPNVINAVGENPITLLLNSLSRWLYNAVDDAERLEVLLSFTREMLGLFLSYGLDPQMVLRKNLKQFVIIFNSAILDPSFIHHLNQLFRSIIRAGGNPNLINLVELQSSSNGSAPSTSVSSSSSHQQQQQQQQPSTSTTTTGGTNYPSPRKYTVSYYLARGLYIHARYRNEAAFDILDVFCATLCQAHLTRCVDGICSNLDHEFEQGPRNARVQGRVKLRSSEPRRLKQLCRISVCRAIGWKVGQHARNLPLPQPLRDYIWSLE